MLRRFLSTVIVIFYTTGLALAANQSQIVGYLPDYRVDAIDVSVGQFVTDLIFFSLEPTDYGTLDDSRFNISIQNKLAQIKNEYDIRIHVALGGWERSSGFAAMATNDTLRADFIEELTYFCQDYDFDGVDYDWEFPKNENENSAYAALIVETKEAFQPYGLIVTSALNVSQNLKSEAYEALDHIHVMSYDHAGQHSTYNQAVNDITNFLNRGIVSEKIYLGVPFYGRHISNWTAYTYSEIISTYNPAPDVDQVDGIYFNGITTIKRKTEYAINNNLGGIMIWEVGQDTRDETSLLVAIKETFDLMSGLLDSQEKIPSEPLLYQNYPNPFNPRTVISWQLAADSEVELSVYNTLGQKVVTLVSEWQEAGYHQVAWDASGIASGIYYYRLTTEQGSKHRKMILMI
jgi:hypothetical protein